MFDNNKPKRMAPAGQMNSDLASQYSNGLKFSVNPDVNVGIRGDGIADMLAPDTQERDLLDGARGSESAFQDNLSSERDRLNSIFGQQADREANRVTDSFRQMAAQNTRDAYGNALEQNTFNSYRTGNMNSSANSKRVSKVYESTLQKRLQDESDAISAGRRTRDQYMNLNGSLQDMMSSVLSGEANTRRDMLNTYQSTRPQEISELAAYLEDILGGVNMASNAAARGVEDAYRVVF